MSKTSTYKTIISVLATLVLLVITVTCASCATLHVGPGQTYNTDGTADEVEINKAFSAAVSGDTVYLHAATYKINSPIILNNKNNIVFKGDGTANTIIQAASYNTALGSSPAHMSMIEYVRAQNVETYGMTVKGVLPQVQPEDYDSDSSNDDSNNGVFLYACKGINMHDMKFTQLSMDAIYSDGSSNVIVKNCNIDTCKHDCIQCWGGNYWTISNCYMHVQSDTGVRYQGTTNSVVTGCTMDNIVGAYANGGVYLQNQVNNITISGNTFNDFTGNVYGAIYARPGETTTGTISVGSNTYNNCVKAINPEQLTVIELGQSTTTQTSQTTTPTAPSNTVDQSTSGTSGNTSGSTSSSTSQYTPYKPRYSIPSYYYQYFYRFRR